MPSNLFSIDLHSTFNQKVKNFPDDLYYFNDGDNLTTLMKTLLGNSGTGQLKNLQIVAQIGQQKIEFSNLDDILGLILHVSRISPEIYSFATNPFIDQLTDDQWQEVETKDADYRERLLGAAEAFQTGCTLWGVLTLCEALTQIKFYAVESWRTPGYGRAGISALEEIVLIPLLDSTNNSGFWQWNNAQKNAILSSIQNLTYGNFQISFGNPIQTFTQTSGSYVAASGYSEYFHLGTTVASTTLNTPSNIQPGSSTRYWIANDTNNVAPYFAHLQTQEISIDMTGSITYSSTTDNSQNPSNSVANQSLNVTATVYGAQ